MHYAMCAVAGEIQRMESVEEGARGWVLLVADTLAMN